MERAVRRHSHAFAGKVSTVSIPADRWSSTSRTRATGGGSAGVGGSCPHDRDHTIHPASASATDVPPNVIDDVHSKGPVCKIIVSSAIEDRRGRGPRIVL
jgi:hypothetical protein